MHTFTLIGAGSVATHFAVALVRAGMQPCQVYSRTERSANALAEKIHAQPITHLNDLTDDAHLYIVALTDNVIAQLLPDICSQRRHRLFCHTAGSVDMDVFRPYADHYGIIYPLQTLSLQHHIDMRRVPLFVEACDDDTLRQLTDIARAMVPASVTEASSLQRRKLHLAAVFAANFVNHCYDVAHHLLSDEGFDFDVLRPLIEETAEKINTLTPQEAQTGPARRHDTNTINAHLHMLMAQPQLHKLYQTLTESIQTLHRADQ